MGANCNCLLYVISPMTSLRRKKYHLTLISYFSFFFCGLILFCFFKTLAFAINLLDALNPTQHRTTTGGTSLRRAKVFFLKLPFIHIVQCLTRALRWSARRLLSPSTSNGTSDSDLVLQVQNTNVNHSQRVTPSIKDCDWVLYVVCLSIDDSPFSPSH